MGFIKAGIDALGGTFAAQWKDFLTVPDGLPPTAAVFPAVPRGQNAGRGENTEGPRNIITNGSKIVVPEGYGLITIQDGRPTGLVTESGGFIFSSDDPNSQSVFAGGGLLNSTLKTSWEQFKFGGQPGSQQLAFFVSLKELPNNRFGTQSEIYWDDAYLNAQVGAITRGTYTLKIVDPLLFLANFVPAVYYSANAPVFDFSDLDNAAAAQLFNEVVGSLAPAFSHYTNDPNKGNRMARIQGDAIGFAHSLSAAVDDAYGWTRDRGLTIVKVAIAAIEYDADTRELLSKVKRADALAGARGNSNLQASVAEGFESAGEHAGPGGIFGMGMAGQAAGLGGLQQPTGVPVPAPQPAQAAAPAAPPAQEEDPVAKLKKFKEMLDAGLITEEDYAAAKAKALGL